MPNNDEGHKLTERELNALEKRIADVYGQAAKELDGVIKDYFEKLKQRDEEMRKLIGTELNGKTWTERDYKQWRINQLGRGKRFEVLRDKLAERMTKANETAVAYVNDATPTIYSINRNYTAYTIEQSNPSADFTLWDERTVKRLIVESPDLMPHYPLWKAVKRGIDLDYGRKQITASVTSGILQGKGIDNIARDLLQRISDMSLTSAIRTARTAVTEAQNAGRQDTYEAAADMGIKVRKMWLATLDGRTRHEHGMLDGQKVEQDKPFEYGGMKLMFPADSTFGAPPSMIYNCRCTMVYVDELDELLDQGMRRAIDPETGESVLVPWMSYNEWAGQKKANNVFTNNDEDVILNTRNMANGLRKSYFIKLSDDDKNFVEHEAMAIGIPREIISFRDNRPTGYSDTDNKIYISSSVFPSNDSSTIASDRMSVRAVLAHEYYGHAKHRYTILENESWQDEFRASYTAAKNTPNLSDDDIKYLLLDAISRATKAGVTITYNSFIRSKLYGYD